MAMRLNVIARKGIYVALAFQHISCLLEIRFFGVGLHGGTSLYYRDQYSTMCSKGKVNESDVDGDGNGKEGCGIWILTVGEGLTTSVSHCGDMSCVGLGLVVMRVVSW